MIVTINSESVHCWNEVHVTDVTDGTQHISN